MVRVVASTSPMLGNESVVVGPRWDAGATRDEPFESRKKTDAVQRPVAPSGGDAIRRLMGLPMMPAVFGATQDETAILKPSDDGGRGRAMRPQMKLVGEQAHAAQTEAEDPQSPAPRGVLHQKQGRCEHRDLQERDVAVAIDEIPSEEILRIEVMDPEGT